MIYKQSVNCDSERNKQTERTTSVVHQHV